jgi:hypothetical protein
MPGRSDIELSATSETERQVSHETENWTLTRRFRATNTRGRRVPRHGRLCRHRQTQRAHVYSAADVPVDPEAYKKIDPKRLAEANSKLTCAWSTFGRFWMMDELEVLAETRQNFHGVDMFWAGDMTGAEMIAQFETAYCPCLIRRDTIWTFKAGKHRASAARARRHGLGLAGIHQGGRSEPDPDNLDELGKKYTTLPKAGPSRPRC